MVTLANELQPSNEASLIFFTESGMPMSCNLQMKRLGNANELQPSKASYVTELGMVTLANTISYLSHGVESGQACP